MIDSDDRPRSAGRGTLEIDVVASDSEDRSLIPELVALGARAAGELGASGSARVRLVRDAEMAAMHERYSGVPGTTDVLTFDLRDGASGDLDVDIILCTDEARRQAAARAIPVGSELVLYFVHALLHCLGHDDHDDAAYEAMHAEEDRVLSAIGLGPVFSRFASDESADERSGGAS